MVKTFSHDLAQLFQLTIITNKSMLAKKFCQNENFLLEIEGGGWGGDVFGTGNGAEFWPQITQIKSPDL